MFHVPEKFRVKTGLFGSDSSYKNNGQFVVKSLKLKSPLFCQASDGAGWEHVSVSLKNRTPTWDEMCFIKSVFWDEDDCIVQYHPPKTDYVNNHSFCLHLWRPINQIIATPPSILVGVTNG